MSYHSNEGVGFFPGQASFAYFFFFGSSGSSNWMPSTPVFDGTPILIPPGGAAAFGGDGAISISGAGLGKGIPNLDDREDANKDGPLKNIFKNY